MLKNTHFLAHTLFAVSCLFVLMFVDQALGWGVFTLAVLALNAGSAAGAIKRDAE